MIAEQVSHYRIVDFRLQTAEVDRGVAVDVRDGRRVVLTWLRTTQPADAATRQRLETDLGSLATLHHPNLARVVDWGAARGTLFQIEEHVGGETLEDRLRRRPLAVLEVMRIGRAIAEGLAHAHFCGCVHGDLRPQNVVVGVPTGACLVAFDARRVNPAGGVAAINAPSMHERQAADRLEADTPVARDVWGLGAVLYRCLTGRSVGRERPGRKRASFADPADPAALALRVSWAPAAESAAPAEFASPAGPYAPDALREGIPAGVTELVLACLAPDPHQRPESAELVASRLWMLENEVLAATPDRSPARVARLLGSLGYRVIERLGTGGMANVWLAEDLRLERQVAIKALRRDVSESEAVRRFLREARAAARLDHPNIVPMFDIRESEGHLFLVMAYVRGRSLRERIQQSAQHPLRLEDVVRWTMEAAEGLAEAHEHGIVHRDLKPDNLLLSASGHVRISDFGLARLEDSPSTRTDRGAIVGTASYMSPEQVQGETVDHRTDLFSLGVTLYELLAGQRPFQGKNLGEVWNAIVCETPPSLEEVRGDVPSDLSRLVDALLRKTAADRPKTALDVVRRLSQIMHTLISHGA